MFKEEDRIILEKFRLMYIEASAKVMNVSGSRINVEWESVDSETIKMNVFLDGKRVSDDMDQTIAAYVHSLKYSIN